MNRNAGNWQTACGVALPVVLNAVLVYVQQKIVAPPLRTVVGLHALFLLLGYLLVALGRPRQGWANTAIIYFPLAFVLMFVLGFMFEGAIGGDSL